MSWQQPNYDPNVPYGQYGEQQYGMQPTGQYQQYGQPTGWTSTPQYQPQQPQQQWQQSPQSQQQQASGASWLESYQIGPYEAKLREAFNHWDKNQSGHIDAQELEQAMRELGESDITSDTVPLMIEMFDKDKSGTIDFTEFGELFAYIQDMKGAFQNADANGERALNMDQVKMALGRVHGPLLYAGGAGLAFALFKLYDKKRKGTLDWPNFLKTALRFGSLRTGFEHSNQQQQAHHGKPQQQSSSYPPQQQQYSQGLGQFQQSYPPQQQSYNQYSMGTGTGSYSQQPQQYGFAKDPNMVDQFVEFASNFIDMQRK